jgi:hypothetical protein
VVMFRFLSIVIVARACSTKFTNELHLGIEKPRHIVLCTLHISINAHAMCFFGSLSFSFVGSLHSLWSRSR